MEEGVDTIRITGNLEKYGGIRKFRFGEAEEKILLALLQGLHGRKLAASC